jgi:uncharacterized membrane protein YqjE
MDYFIIGLVTALNLIVIKVKFDKKRWEDAVLDLSILALLAYVFGGSYGGLVVATTTSLIISAFFLISPPTFLRKIKGFL